MNNDANYWKAKYEDMRFLACDTLNLCENWYEGDESTELDDLNQRFNKITVDAAAGE